MLTLDSVVMMVICLLNLKLPTRGESDSLAVDITFVGNVLKYSNFYSIRLHDVDIGENRCFFHAWYFMQNCTNFLPNATDSLYHQE